VLPQFCPKDRLQVPIHQTTRRHTYEDCNLHLKIVRTSFLATQFGFPIHKQNCALFQSARFTQTCSLERTTCHPEQRNAISCLVSIYKLLLLLLLLPLALQPAVGFGLSNKILPCFPICHQLSPSSLSPSSFFLCSTFVTMSFFTVWGC
jgi:hypothetical protein